MKFICQPEECIAGAIYLHRILWLDKEVLEKLCYLAFFIYWFVVGRNRCLTDSCGYIFNWAWWLLKFGWMLFNIFTHTSAACCLPAISLTTPWGREELWTIHISFPSMCFKEHACKIPTETLHAGPAEAVHTLFCVLLASSYDSSVVISSWGEDAILLWVGYCRTLWVAAGSVF